MDYIILYNLFFNQIPFNDLEDCINSNKKVILKMTNNNLLDDLLNKLIVKGPEKRINWDNYYKLPFNTQKIIEIYVNIEKEYTNTKILDKNFQMFHQKNLYYSL